VFHHRRRRDDRLGRRHRSGPGLPARPAISQYRADAAGEVKYTYKLSLQSTEKTALEQMLAAC
jgi:hypothetical protein